mmetsp:Transcript_116321/g.237948  ORF Transcript_116321/g.237948 Transcript_116321/m.237948 type:complete len:146 (-) Transcript_116321:72-509(-)
MRTSAEITCKEMRLRSQTARERGAKIQSAREAVADGLTLHQYITEAAGVFNHYAVKRGSSEYNKQQQWREQGRIDFITEQQQVQLAPNLLKPRPVGDENKDPRQLVTQPTTNAGKEEDTMRFELPPQSSSSEEEEGSDEEVGGVG